MKQKEDLGDLSKPYTGLKKIVFNKYLYISIIVLIFGMALNNYSQYYLYKKVSSGTQLPKLSDLILDNIPYIDLSWIYDWLSGIVIVLFILFVFQKNEYKKIPYYILIIGIFQMFRGIFIILTPLGSPPGYIGSTSIFHSWSIYDLGVYPSGHTGTAFLIFLLTYGLFKPFILLSTILIIISLFLSRGHYSIDILSGILFAYAIYCFGEKYLKKKFSVKN